MNLACYAWIHVRRAPLTDIGSQVAKLQAVLEGLPPPWDLFGLNSAQALADFVRLPSTYQSTDKNIGKKSTYDLLAIANQGGAAAPIFWLIAILSLSSTLPAAYAVEDMIACISTYFPSNQDNSTQTSSNTSTQLSSDTNCQSHINRLYCIILFLKTASLLTCIKYQDSKAQLALKFIWLMVETLVLTTPQVTTADEEGLEKGTSVLIVELIVPLLRQLIAKDPPSRHNLSNAVIDVVRHVLKLSTPIVQSAIATELLHQGRTSMCEHTLRSPLPHEMVTQTEACETPAAMSQRPACL